MEAAKACCSSSDRITAHGSRNGKPWSQDEVAHLVRLVNESGEGEWLAKAKVLGTGRSAKSVTEKYSVWRARNQF